MSTQVRGVTTHGSGRTAWIDWMKCLGMLLIVLGHTGADNLLNPTPPFNFKQLGVAFFVFVMGYSLATENRRAIRVVYNRLFEVYLFGGLFALIMSGVTLWRIGDLQESNYMPLVGGVNVFFNFFPANPTTWYIGTYLHLLLLWALFWRRLQIRPWIVVLALVLEIPCRAVLIGAAGEFVAYMLFTNWVGVFLLGMWASHRTSAAETSRPKSWLPLIGCGLLAAGIVLWPILASASLDMSEGFPFETIQLGNGLSLMATSTVVTALYYAYTWLTYRGALHLPSSKVVEFFARNTLIVFIVHMPLVSFWAPAIYRSVPQGLGRVLVNVLCFYVLPACASEMIRRWLSPVRVRERIALWFTERIRPALTTDT